MCLHLKIIRLTKMSTAAVFLSSPALFENLHKNTPPAPAMVAAFDPLAPSQASSSTSPDNTTFHTLTRERQFRHPPLNASDVPALDELVAPHIKSFNALIEDEGNPGAKGLLQIGVEDIGEKVVFDGKGSEGGLGTKLSCMSGDSIAQSLANAHLIRPNRPSRS